MGKLTFYVADSWSSESFKKRELGFLDNSITSQLAIVGSGSHPAAGPGGISGIKGDTGYRRGYSKQLPYKFLSFNMIPDAINSTGIHGLNSAVYRMSEELKFQLMLMYSEYSVEDIFVNFSENGVTFNIDVLTQNESRSVFTFRNHRHFDSTLPVSPFFDFNKFSTGKDDMVQLENNAKEDEEPLAISGELKNVSIGSHILYSGSTLANSPPHLNPPPIQICKGDEFFEMLLEDVEEYVLQALVPFMDMITVSKTTEEVIEHIIKCVPLNTCIFIFDMFCTTYLRNLIKEHFEIKYSTIQLLSQYLEDCHANSI